eukprot:CAMPEP_0118938880 /NCGR_PEP_ID=MMETSP1169-20130426/27320_1 /TAXON_ID=36882 /ORGANISM="Pyramimonas obovata, Strain CCMP722" /LENGTH=374 /DNA_ID=CAMNT_0006882977 /DNA_START=262 /DNA_END=1386 /DNA_ORIENTATION=+
MDSSKPESDIAPEVRVVTYNVLSSKLARSEQFPSCAPEDLKANVRYKRILTKLEAEVEQGSILCLQEVPMEWAGDLHTFFQQRGFHFLVSLYGTPFNGYMGVGIAFPVSKYRAEKMKLARLSDFRRDWPRPPRPNALQKALKAVSSPAVGLWRLGTKSVRGLLNLPRPDQKVDEWQYSMRRFNSIATVKLQCDATGSVFSVSTYHMPCAFWAPKVMTIHTALCAQFAEREAGGVPWVLCGDFNIKPSDLQYQLLTEGRMDPNHPQYTTGCPVKPDYDNSDWAAELKTPLRSAYKEALGSEPDFTNYAQVREQPPFIETLDYVFLSPGWAVAQVLPLVHRDEAGGPFPNASEPSDHVLIGAALTLPAPEAAAPVP